MNARQRAALLSGEDDVIPFGRKKKVKSSVTPKVVKAATPRGKTENFNLMKIDPLTEGQRQVFFAFKEGLNVVATGSAGTGKTYTATYLALEKLMAKETEKIVFIRSAVNIRTQGHLPGTQAEKEAVYTVPFKNTVNQLLQCGTAWDSLTKNSLIEFTTTTYIRGVTFDNCIVIIDEFQNMDPSEMESVLTRLGENTQLIVCGDTRQNDLNRKRETSCHEWLLKVVHHLPKYFDVVNFTSEDVVRSKLCKAIIKAIESVN